MANPDNVSYRKKESSGLPTGAFLLPKEVTEGNERSYRLTRT